MDLFRLACRPTYFYMKKEIVINLTWFRVAGMLVGTRQVRPKVLNDATLAASVAIHAPPSLLPVSTRVCLPGVVVAYR